MSPPVDSNIKMWCGRCRASTKGDICSLCLRGFTVCAECGWCFACQSMPAQRASGKDW